MTDQLSPPQQADADSTNGAVFAPPTRLDRVKGEIMAGGAVDESTDEELAGGWKGFLAMGAILAAFVALAFYDIWIFVFVVGVVVSIFLHEMGHFVTARRSGMKVTQFFLFFGPRLWSFRRGETEYGVRAVPLGAFVRIVGMNRMDEVDPADEGRTYRQQPFPQRLLVISAGSITHMLIAVVLLFGVYATQGELTSKSEPVVMVGSVRQNLPAAQAGIVAGDQIATVGGVAVASPIEVGNAVRTHKPGDVIDVEVVRDGQTITIPVGLEANTTVPANDPLFGTALLGVSSYNPPHYQHHNIVSAGTNAVTDLVPVSWESTKGIVKVLNPVNIVGHLTGSNTDLSTRPTTLVGVAGVSDDVGRSSGLAGVLYLLAVLNVFVGVFNMMPLLPLDGGHAAIAAYERVQERRRRTSQRYFADVERLMPVAVAVIGVLAMLMFTGLYLDITKPIG